MQWLRLSTVLNIQTVCLSCLFVLHIYLNYVILEIIWYFNFAFFTEWNKEVLGLYANPW